MENKVANILHNLYYSALMSKDFTTYHGSLKIVCTLVRGDLHKYYLPDNKGKLVSISEDEAIQYISKLATLLENNNESKVAKEGG